MDIDTKRIAIDKITKKVLYVNGSDLLDDDWSREMGSGCRSTITRSLQGIDFHYLGTLSFELGFTSIS